MILDWFSDGALAINKKNSRCQQWPYGLLFIPSFYSLGFAQWKIDDLCFKKKIKNKALSFRTNWNWNPLSRVSPPTQAFLRELVFRPSPNTSSPKNACVGGYLGYNGNRLYLARLLDIQISDFGNRILILMWLNSVFKLPFCDTNTWLSLRWIEVQEVTEQTN